MPTVDTTTSCDLTRENFARLATYITGELGIRMPECKLTMVQSRLLRRVRELGLTSVQQYCDHFFDAENAGEREHFINAVTTNKTDFFREPQHFTFLSETVLPGLTGGRTHSPSRVQAWSAGCSSGEEAYSLAMVLSQFTAQRRELDFALLATDVSTRVLELARTGIYEIGLIDPVPPELRARYMLRGNRDSRHLVRMKPALRRKISFHQLNFMDEDYGVQDVFDFIFFRNVMIYFDKKTQERVVNRLCRNLAPGGYLFVGHSETLAGLNIPVKPVRVAVYRMPGAAL